MCVFIFDSDSLHSGAFQHPLPESSCVTSFKHTPESLLVTQPFMLLVSLTQEGSEREERRAEMWGKRKKTKLTVTQHGMSLCFMYK